VLDGSIGDGFLGMLDGVDLVGFSWFDAGGGRLRGRAPT